MKKEDKMVEIWGDVVSIKHLIISIVISSLSTMGGYFLAAKGDNIRQLFYGLLGAVLGLIISALTIKPKRIISLEDSIDEKRR